MAPTSSPTSTVDVVDELASRAAFQRPDLSTAFSDDGWLAIRLTDVLISTAGLAFAAGELAIARPAVARHASDFIAFSERLGSLVGLRHGDHFAFADEAAA
ncbi:hypothetical protein DSM104299_05021 [Baekduia alba]|uniref:hypothetical protein n=1 Tax=Baekduia alba TaxID=2997333 RepID=UPI002340E8D6|nr:hypothetical protein [Baekduia alba]WCB96264.1 hypothetical protein DSM104299_05021 [Baekduia alba]